MTNSKPKPTVSAPVEIAIVDFAGAQATSVYGLTDLFSYANFFACQHANSTAAALRLTHWRPDVNGAMQCVYESCRGESHPPAVVILPACQRAPPPPRLAPESVAWARQQHGHGALVAAVCGGVFLLAESGLLAGRRATTHWMFADELQRRFPDIHVNPEQLVIDDQDLLTAGGVLAWADLGLRLVERLLGATVMSSTAHFMLMDARGREQRHFGAFSPRMQHGDKAILAVQHWLQANPARSGRPGSLARRAGLSDRTFLRRFTAATGTTPGDYLQQLRVARCRERLEFTRESVEKIAHAVGYEDAGTLRRVFKRVTGLSPAQYRRKFQATAPVA